jgi:hypothetical protein
LTQWQSADTASISSHGEAGFAFVGTVDIRDKAAIRRSRRIGSSLFHKPCSLHRNRKFSFFTFFHTIKLIKRSENSLLTV